VNTNLDFKKLLLMYLKKHNMTQKQLSDEISGYIEDRLVTGLDEASISRKINLKRSDRFSTKELLAMCNVFDLDSKHSEQLVIAYKYSILNLKKHKQRKNINKFKKIEKELKTHSLKYAMYKSQLLDYLNNTPLFNLDHDYIDSKKSTHISFKNTLKGKVEIFVYKYNVKHIYIKLKKQNRINFNENKFKELCDELLKGHNIYYDLTICTNVNIFNIQKRYATLNIRDFLASLKSKYIISELITSCDGHSIYSGIHSGIIVLEPIIEEEQKELEAILGQDLSKEFQQSNFELSIREDTFFFPEVVDYCIDTTIPECIKKHPFGFKQRPFSILPENTIAGIISINRTDEKSLQDILNDIPDIKNKIFYILRTNNKKDYSIAYIDFDFKDKKITLYPNGRNSEKEVCPLNDVEIFGYVKGYYKCLH